jgi:RNase P subunit RPR2
LNCRKGRYNLRQELKKRAKIKTMLTACKHPRVRIVSRQEDTEYVECLECGDVFDSEEFNDMAIEESAEKEQQQADE